MSLSPRHQRNITALRYTSNTLVVIGYFVLMNVSVTWGVAIRLIAAAMVIPWLIQHKIWDGVTVVSIMTAVDIHKFVELLFF